MASLEERVATLEAEVAVLRQAQVLNALRETQLEHGQRLDDLAARVDRIDGTVTHIRDQHGAKLGDIAAMLGQLIEREEGGGATPTAP